MKSLISCLHSQYTSQTNLIVKRQNIALTSSNIASAQKDHVSNPSFSNCSQEKGELSYIYMKEPRGPCTHLHFIFHWFDCTLYIIRSPKHKSLFLIKHLCQFIELWDPLFPKLRLLSPKADIVELCITSTEPSVMETAMPTVPADWAWPRSISHDSALLTPWEWRVDV